MALGEGIFLSKQFWDYWHIKWLTYFLIQMLLYSQPARSSCNYRVDISFFFFKEIPSKIVSILVPWTLRLLLWIYDRKFIFIPQNFIKQILPSSKQLCVTICFWVKSSNDYVTLSQLTRNFSHFTQIFNFLA